MSQRPTLAVTYDAGAVPAGEVGIGLADLGDVVFLVPPGSAHVRALLPVLSAFGKVEPLSGRPDDDAALVRALAPDAVLTFSERLVRQTAELSSAAGVAGHSPATGRAFTDKGLQRRLLRDAGIDATRTFVLTSPGRWEEALRAVGLPLMVKPVTGWSSRDVHAVRTPREAEQMRRYLTTMHESGAWDSFVVEEYLPGRDTEPFGDYVSVESLCTTTGISHFVITGKTPVLAPFRGTGRVWPSHLPGDELREIEELVSGALRAVGAGCGYAHTEVKLTPAGPRIIEINGRLSAHINAMGREVRGIDLVRIGGLAALGEDPPLPALDFGDSVFYQYNNLAPLRGGRLMAVDGADAARDVPGVLSYRAFVRPGDTFPGGSTTVTLDAVTGECAAHGDVMPSIDRVRSALCFEIAFDDETRRLGALELPHW